MDVLLSAVGATPLITHNERLQDPLDPLVQSISLITGKRKKAEADHFDIARMEFEGGLYLNGNGPCLPAMNIFRCLEDGGKRVKRGMDVKRGIRPDPGVVAVDLIYDGPRETEKLWAERDTFAIRKGVVVSGRRVTRTRPIFHEWAFAAPFVVDDTIWNFADLAEVWRLAGLYAGLGEMRPIYGQFEATAERLTPELRKWLGEDHQDFHKFVEYIRNGAKERAERHA